MKITNKILVLAFMAVAMVFASCSKDDNDPIVPTQQEIETKIVGKWKKATMNGEPVLTNAKAVTSYYGDKTAIGSTVFYNHETLTYVWENKKNTHGVWRGI